MKPTKGVIMDDEWTELRKEMGKVIEATGRMLQRNPALTKQDLTDLRDTLSHGAEMVQIIRDRTFV
jgi:hypothetical protein